MLFVRSIGRWTLTALMINCIIGSGIFGVPEPLMASVGRASPIAMIVAGLCMCIIVACFAEVGSQFSEPGGVYLYARTAFGRFAGLQLLALTGTFRWAVVLSAGAAMIFDGAVCAALLRLRRIQPKAAVFRLPFGPAFSVLGMAVCLVLLSRMELRQVLLMGITTLIATANWWWARRRDSRAAQLQIISTANLTTPVP
jgi:amino acid transporter